MTKHHRAKLEPEDVNLIMDLSYERKSLLRRLDEISPSALAERFGISRQRVWAIAKKCEENADYENNTERNTE